MGQPRPLFRLFSVFSVKHYNFTTNQCEKCLSSIRRCNSNSQTYDYESPPLTTRPGLGTYEGEQALGIDNSFENQTTVGQDLTTVGLDWTPVGLDLTTVGLDWTTVGSANVRCRRSPCFRHQNNTQLESLPVFVLFSCNDGRKKSSEKVLIYR